MTSGAGEAVRREGRTASRRFLQVIMILVWCAASPSPAFAHMGGMSAEDFRPMAVSAAVAFVSYWLVLLWPSRPATTKWLRRRNTNTPFEQNGPEPVQQPHRLKQVTHLRTVGGSHGRDSATND